MLTAPILTPEQLALRIGIDDLSVIATADGANDMLIMHDADADVRGKIAPDDLLADADAVLGRANLSTATAVPVVSSTAGTLDESTMTVDASGNVVIPGNLTVNGTTTTIDTTDLAVEDPLIALAVGNSADTLDIGVYGTYNDGTQRYGGLFRDSSDGGTWKLFDTLTEAPSTTVNTGGTGYALADLDVAGLDVDTLIAQTSASVPALTVTASATFAGATIADLGTVTTADIDGGTLDGVTIGGASAAPATVTTLDTTGVTTFGGNVDLDGYDFDVNGGTLKDSASGIITLAASFDMDGSGIDMGGGPLNMEDGNLSMGSGDIDLGTGSLSATSDVIIESDVLVEKASPRVEIKNSSAGTDSKTYVWRATTNAMYFSLVDDAGADVDDIMGCSRTGTTVSSVNFYDTVSFAERIDFEAMVGTALSNANSGTLTGVSVDETTSLLMTSATNTTINNFSDGANDPGHIVNVINTQGTLTIKHNNTTGGRAVMCPGSVDLVITGAGGFAMVYYTNAWYVFATTN